MYFFTSCRIYRNFEGKRVFNCYREFSPYIVRENERESESKKEKECERVRERERERERVRERVREREG